MNKLSVTVSAIALLGSTSYGLAANQLETVLDLAFRGIIEEGSDISYDERIIGDDGSVEYINLVISSPDGGVSVDSIKGVPSASDPETVTFTLSDTVSFTGIEDGETFNFDLRTSGFSLVTNAILREAMSTGDISVTMDADSFVVEGGDPDSEVFRKLFADLGTVDFDLLVSEEETRVEGALTASQLNAEYDFTADGDRQVSSQTTEAMSVIFEMDIPDDEEDALGYLDGSKTASLKMVAGASTSESSIESEGMAFSIAGTSGASTAVIEMVGGTAVYDAAVDGIDMTITPGEGVPFPPVDITMGDFEMKAIVPLNSAETPSEMVIDILLADLEVGEGLWSMIDPDKTISRDPTTLDIDLEALVQIDAMAGAMGSGDPMEFATIHSLDVNQILVSVGGASIQADGAMTFNNDGPFPMPIGGVNIDMIGIQTVANQLVALGLIDQMQAGMAMGMMMAFAKPGAETDQFVSEITFTKDGEILANGQPIQ